MNLSKTIILLIMCLCCLKQSFQAQTTEFTYQGRLLNVSTPATGNYDFEFALFDALSGGAQIGATLTRTSVAVTDGIFNVKLDFGSQFPGANRFLEISVRQPGGGAFTPLTPRQQVNSSPYSLKAVNADNAVNAANATNASQLGGVAASQYVLTGDARLSDARAPTAGSGAFQVDATGIAGGRLNIAQTGEISFGTLGAAGTDHLCRNASNQISSCSSSIRYKTHINPFNQGLSLIKQLRPLSFNWRANNQADLGLVAEEVAAVEPLLTTTNSKGEIEGVKYDRVSVVLINAVKEQQTQIESQRSEIRELKEQVNLLREIVCKQNGETWSAFCKAR